MINVIFENIDEFEATNVSVWQKDNLGEGTTIVVLDEGFIPYEYMKENVEVMLCGYDGKKDTTETGHGAGVMSIGYEIAPRARIVYMPFNEVGSDDRHRMIDWILENKDEIDVITMSLSFSALTGRKYFDRLKDCGIPFFVASGNDGEEDGVNYPANEPFTIAVGSGYENNVLRYSNGGPELICVSPLILGYNSRMEPTFRYGTSFSAPYSAFATLLYTAWRRRNKLPKLMHEDCIEFIKENAQDFIPENDRSSFKEGFDYLSGWGMFRLPPVVPEVSESAPDIEEQPEPIPEEDENMSSFTDTKGHWAEEEIEFLREKGEISGFPDGTFKPERALTRAEYAHLKAKELGFVKKK